MDVATLQAAKNDAKRKYPSRKTLMRSLRNVQDAFPALHPAPPTVAWYGPGGASPITSAVTVSYRTARATFLGMTPVYTDASQYASNGVNAGGSGKCFAVEFDHHGTDVAVLIRDTDGTINDRAAWVWVDGQPVTPGLAGTVGLTATVSGTFRLRLTWATRGRHRVRVYIRGAHAFRGFEHGPLDTIAATARPNLRIAVLGDSYVDGANYSGRTVTDGVLNSTTTITSATAAFVAGDVKKVVIGAGISDGTRIASVTNGTTAVLDTAATTTASAVQLTVANDGAYDVDTWPQILGRMLGAEVFSAGQGGTGYLNPSTGGKAVYGDTARLAAIVAAQPNLIFVAGSVNDDLSNGYTASALTTAAAAVYAYFATNAPNVPVVVFGPQVTGVGSSTVTSRFQTRDAMKAAAVAAPNVLGFIDPITGTTTPPAWAATTVYNAGDTVLSAGGVYICLLAHTSSGSFDSTKWDLTSWFNGTGYTLFPSGSGNRDVLLANDQVHPTKLGHIHYAMRGLEALGKLLPTI